MMPHLLFLIKSIIVKHQSIKLICYHLYHEFNKQTIDLDLHACSHFMRQILTWHGIYANDYIHELNYRHAHFLINQIMRAHGTIINRIITIHDH